MCIAGHQLRAMNNPSPPMFEQPISGGAGRGVAAAACFMAEVDHKGTWSADPGPDKVQQRWTHRQEYDTLW